MLDGDEDRVQEDEDDHQPVETLRLDQATYSKPKNMYSDRHVQYRTKTIWQTGFQATLPYKFPRHSIKFGFH